MWTSRVLLSTVGRRMLPRLETLMPCKYWTKFCVTIELKQQRCSAEMTSLCLWRVWPCKWVLQHYPSDICILVKLKDFAWHQMVEIGDTQRHSFEARVWRRDETRKCWTCEDPCVKKRSSKDWPRHAVSLNILLVGCAPQKKRLRSAVTRWVAPQSKEACDDFLGKTESFWVRWVHMQTRVVHISASTHGDKFRASFGCGYGQDAPISKK